MTPLLYIVIPCYNNGEIIPFSVKFYKEKIEELSLCGKISGLSRILLVDNGSTDNSWDKILYVSEKNAVVKGIRLGSYSGKTNAILCGIENAKKYSDIVIVADCRCRKDINAIDRMIDEYEKGALIVCGKQEKIKGFSNRFNKANACVDFEYILLTKEVMQEFEKYTEFEIDFKKILSGMNFRASCVYYKRRNTFALKEKPTLKRVKEKFFAFFSNNYLPIHFVFGAGVLSASICFLIFLTEILFNCFGKEYEIGKMILFLLASFDVAAVGMIGEYLIKVINELKKHPRYTVVAVTKDENNSVSAV